MEGKDRPTELGKKKWEELGKTVGLMLQMCESIFSTSKCVVLGEVLVIGISQYTRGPLFSILDERSSVDTNLQQGCEPPLTHKIHCQAQHTY